MRHLLGAAVLAVAACGLSYGAEKGEFYSLQLATFSSKTAAFRFLNSLPSSVKEKAKVYREAGVYSVKMGVFPSAEQASTEARKLRQKFGLSAVVVKVSSSKQPVKEAVSKKLQPASEKFFYSLQLAAFRDPSRAEAFIGSLPEPLRDEAFVYKTSSGLNAVRVWLSEDLSSIKSKPEEVREKFGLKGFLVKSRPERVARLYRVEGKGSSSPAVKDRTLSYPGTPENRRATLKATGFSPSGAKVKVNLSKVAPHGLYKVNISLSHLYPVPKVYGAKLFVSIPKDALFVVGSAHVNGKKVKVERKNSLLVFDLGDLPGNEPLEVSFSLIVKGRPEEKFPYALLFDLPNRKGILLGDPAVVKVVRGERPPEFPRKKVKAKLGFLFPETDVVVPSSTVEVKFVVPLGSNYQFLVNGAPVPSSLVAEKEVDKARGVEVYRFVGVPLRKGENRLVLKWNGRSEERRVVVSGEIADFRFSVYPERPQADGRTSAYVVIRAYDSKGNPVKASSYLEVFVDRGDVYDYRTGTYKRFVNDGYKVKLVDGKAVVRLSPAKSPEERVIRVVYGEVEREFRVRYYQEERPWIVVGELEGAVGRSATSGDTQKLVDEPYDHSKEGTHFRGRGALFAKGTVRGYTVTLRYDTKRPDDVLMKQNVPSTEENQFYPVYGDDSEQFFEAKSKRHLYLRVDRGLSYFLFGDYNTDLGKEFDFNRYYRTFNGVLLNLEENRNYKLRAFGTKSSQDVLKEEFPGRGTSGPFFLAASPVEFSEKVWIEIRDRYNPDVVIKRRELNRFTDYEINYEEGFIILHEPLPQFDDDFNPEYLVVTYETYDLPKDEYTYGVRVEKWVKGLRLGAFGVKEEHPEKDKKLYGVDAYYYKNGLKFTAEAARSLGFQGDDFEGTSGKAYRVELSYSAKGAQGRLFYKRVTDGFQNPTATTAQEAYRNYGFSLSKDWGKTKVSASGLFDRRSGIKRREADFLVTQKVTEKLSVDLGLRHNREERGGETESYAQGIAGIQYRPTEKLTLQIRREESFGGDKASTYFPTRTIGKVRYRWSSKTSTYLQTEVRELPGETNSLTTFGIESQLDENTSAYSKYTVKDGASGWRTQSHIGLNRVFHWREDLAVDVGLENVQTYGGGDEGDYTAVRVRGLYTQSERYKLSGEYQIRFGEVKNEHLLRLGGVFKPTESTTLLVRERYFLSDYRENEVLLGLAGRPVENDRFNYLLKLRWKITDRDDATNKYIFSFHGNYQPIKRLTLMAEYAVKYVDVKDLGTSLTDLLRGRILYDVTDRVDFGFHAGVIRQRTTSTYTLAWGPEIGFSPVENFWISVGYNFSGFYDDDFDEAEYWSQGPYLKFRLKFDENSFKKLKLLKKARGENN